MKRILFLAFATLLSGCVTTNSKVKIPVQTTTTVAADTSTVDKKDTEQAESKLGDIGHETIVPLPDDVRDQYVVSENTPDAAPRTSVVAETVVAEQGNGLRIQLAKPSTIIENRNNADLRRKINTQLKQLPASKKMVKVPTSKKSVIAGDEPVSSGNDDVNFTSKKKRG